MGIKKNSYRHWTHRAGRVLHRAGSAYLQGVAFRRGLAKSKTKVITKSEKEKGDDIHSGVTDVTYKIISKTHSAKNVDYKGGKISWSESSNTFQQPGPAGNLVITDFVQALTTSQLLISNGTAVNYAAAPQKGVTALRTLNPYDGNTGSATLTAANYQASGKLFFDRVNFKVSISNLGTTAASVWVYLLEAKQNHNRSPGACWTFVDQAEGNLVGGTAGEPAAGALTGGNVGSFGSSNVLDFTGPYDSKDFKAFWKPLKIHRVNLAAAAQEDVNFDVVKHFMFDVEKIVGLQSAMNNGTASWTDANINIQYPRGSLALMMVSRGQVVRDTTGVNQVCTFAGTEIGVITTKTYHIRPVKSNAGRVSVKGGYPQIPTAAAAGAQKFINIVDAGATATFA